MGPFQAPPLADREARLTDSVSEHKGHQSVSTDNNWSHSYDLV